MPRLPGHNCGVGGHSAPPNILTWGGVLWGLWARVLVGDALQGRQGHVQAAVGAGPEGAETVAVQVCVALRQEGCTRLGPLPSLPLPTWDPSQKPSGLTGPIVKPHPCTKLGHGWWGGGAPSDPIFRGRGLGGWGAGSGE